jgi:hypothetical protein
MEGAQMLDCCFDWLADELVLHVLSFLPHHPHPSRTVVLLPAVCRRWAWLVRDRSCSPVNLTIDDLVDGAAAVRELRGRPVKSLLAKKGRDDPVAMARCAPLHWSLNVVMCGPRASGKSTLAGLLSYLSGTVQQQELHRTKKQLDDLYKNFQLPKESRGSPYAGRDGTNGKSNVYSALFDRTREERLAGRSIHGHTKHVTLWPR